MKYWKYEMQNIAVVGTDENGNSITKESFFTKYIPYTAENEELAKKEAYNGEYTVEEVDEPEAPSTDAERIAELEEALTMLLNEVTE